MAAITPPGVIAPSGDHGSWTSYMSQNVIHDYSLWLTSVSLVPSKLSSSYSAADRALHAEADALWGHAANRSKSRSLRGVNNKNQKNDSSSRSLQEHSKKNAKVSTAASEHAVSLRRKHNFTRQGWTHLPKPSLAPTHISYAGATAFVNGFQPGRGGRPLRPFRPTPDDDDVPMKRQTAQMCVDLDHDVGSAASVPKNSAYFAPRKHVPNWRPHSAAGQRYVPPPRRRANDEPRAVGMAWEQKQSRCFDLSNFLYMQKDLLKTSKDTRRVASATTSRRSYRLP